MSFGAIQATMDYGMRISFFHYIFGGTWSPRTYADYNSFKHIGLSFFCSFAICWTGIPFEIARVL